MAIAYNNNYETDTVSDGAAAQHGFGCAAS